MFYSRLRGLLHFVTKLFSGIRQHHAPVACTMSRLFAVTTLSFITGCGALSWQDEPTPPSSEQSLPERRLPDSPSVQSPPETSLPTPIIGKTLLTDQLGEFFEQWQDTPYRFGGTNKDGVDCSALTQHVALAVLGIHLPRTTSQQRREGVQIDAADATSGDLVFFRTGRSVYHVGVLMGGNKFMHSSEAHGVSLSRLDDRYWQERVLEFRRIGGGW